MRLFLFSLMVIICSNVGAKSMLISHQKNTSLHAIVKESQERLRKAPTLTLPLEDELTILDQLTKFELGKFLLAGKGLNGYWTQYVILKGKTKKDLPALEKWILTQAPVVLATQQRYKNFHTAIAKRLAPKTRIASIPCGLMDDLLSQDYSTMPDIEILGIDLDAESLQYAQDNIKNYNLKNKVSFLKRNAWDLGLNNELDLITSNGLNIYEPSDEKVIQLYQEFYKALRPGGWLIISFLTPPPALDPTSPWVNYNPADLKKQKALFTEVIGVHWQSFRTEQKTREQLEKSGFKVQEIIYDDAKMFPTIVVQKPLA